VLDENSFGPDYLLVQQHGLPLIPSPPTFILSSSFNLILFPYILDISPDRVSGDSFHQFTIYPWDGSDFGFHAAMIQARLLRERREAFFCDAFPCFTSHVMTIEVPAGLRSWLLLVFLLLVLFFFLSFSSLCARFSFLPFLFFR
jgi:hypothetical protein